MKSLFRFIIVSIVLFFGYSSSGNALSFFVPGPTISLTGANNGVYFDVADDLFGYPSTPPRLYTAGKSFSGSFYLTGAGWVQFDAPGYRVDLDCGTQLLSTLTLPCVLSGTGWSETIGDVVFDKKVFFYPTSGTLSGSIFTNIGTVSFSGVYLPLLRASFMEGTTSQANHLTSLTLSGKTSFGDGGWSINFAPWGYPVLSRLYSDGTLNAVDLSQIGTYMVQITDPNGSTTAFSYLVNPNIPSSSLDPNLASTIRASFCSMNPSHGYCPDGAVLQSTNLKQFGSNLVADGQDYYNFRLSVRDRYGNAVNAGTIQIEYGDTIRDIQMLPADSHYSFFPFGPGFASIASGSMMNTHDGHPKTLPISLAASSNIDYGFASIAPTDTTNALFLSGITYTDAGGDVSHIMDPNIGAPLIFRPWYITSLTTPGDIIIGSDTLFTTYFTNQSSVLNPSATALYGLTIGSTMNAYFTNLMSSPPFSCRQEAYTFGSAECNW